MRFDWSFDINGTGYRFFSGLDKSLTLQMSPENKFLNELEKVSQVVWNQRSGNCRYL